MAVNPVLRQLVADGKAMKNAQSGTQTKMTAAKSAAQSTPMRRSLSNQQKTTSGTKKPDALTSVIISANQKAAQKKPHTAERGSKHYTNRANQQRRAQAQVVANQIKKNNAERANKYSLGKGVAGAVAKGVNQAAQGVASTLALAEDVLLSPFELLSGQKLGDLSDTAPLNKLSQRIKNEGQETQKKYADNVAKGGKAAELLDKYGSATVAAVPQAVMAYLTAGASAGASTAGLGAQAAAKMTPSMAGTIRRGVAAMAKDPNYWTAFSQVVGQSYDEAMDDMAKTGTENNKARTKAALYAMGNGLLNAAVEVGGGIQKLPEELKHGAAAWKAWVNSMVDEGKEEVVQGVIERAMQNSVYDKGNPLASVSDPDAILNPRTAAKEFAGGAIVGGVLGAGQIGAQKVLESRNNRATPQQPTQQAPGAQADVREGTYTTTPANAAEGTQNAAPGVETAANKGETVQIVERLRESIPGLNGTEPVSTVSSKAIPFVEGRTMAEKARKMFEAIKGVVSRPGFGDIDINGRSVKDDLSHGVGGAKAAVIPAIPEVLRRGQQIDFQQNWKGRPYDGYVFAAPVTMDGETAYVAAVVKRTSKNRFYLHEVIDANGNVIKIDAGDRANPTSLATNGDAGTQSQASVEGTRPLNANDSIAQGAENVKNSGSRDILSEVLFGRNRVDLNTMTEAQQDAVFRANEEGTVGMDATGKVFQIDPEQHIDRRRMETVGGRDVNAFQFDHPELHRYYQEAANALIADADLSLQQPMSRRYERTMEGNAVQQAAQTSPHLRQAMNETGLSRDSIIDAAERIVTDHGQENVAAAKRVELILDDMLSHGYTTMTGEQVGPNSGYLTAKQSILGAGEQARGRGLEDVDAFDTPGDAVAGAVNTPFDAMQAKSDEFYPVNPNSAQRIQAEQRRAPSEVPVMNPDTGRNVEKTVSTILNSSLTSPEMATVYENAISGGAFDYDVVTDRSAVQQAQAKIARDGWREVANSFVAKAELGQRITKADTADAISAYNLAISEGDHKAAFELATAIADAAHDSAQMVQAMNLMNRLTPEGRLLTLRRLVDRMNDRAARQNRTPRQSTTDSGDVEGARVDYIDKVTGFTLSDELATNYLMAETDAERAAAWDAITTSIADQIPSTFMEKANFWRYTSMLTNPTTHIRNIMGNAIQMGARKIKNGIGTAIERAVIKDPSQRTKAVNVDKDLKAFAKGQYETDQSAAMGSGKYSDATTAGIEREIQSKRKMFKGKTVHSFGAGDIIAPFTRVAGNLASVGLDYSPVNAVKGTVEIVEAVADAARNGGNPVKQAKAVSDFARGMTGTAIAYGFMQLAKMGLLKRADDEDDKDVAALNKSEGLTGAQINITAAKRWMDGDETGMWRDGDTLVDLSNLEPLNFMVSLGAEMADNGNDGFLSTFGDPQSYTDTADSFVKASADLPVMQTIGNLGKDILVYKKDWKEALPEAVGKTVISSITPNVLASIAKGIDDKQRNVYAGDGTKDVLIDTLKSRIPKVRETLPTTVNTLGEEKDNPGSLSKRLTNAIINPIGVNKYTQSEVSQEMERVRGATGETGFYPTTRKPDSLSYKDSDGKEHTVVLDYDQKQAFQKACATGQMAYTAAMMKTSIYKAAGDTTKAELLDRCYKYSYEAAKAEVLGDGAVDKWVLHARNAKSELDMSTADYLANFEKYGPDVMSGTGFDKTKRMLDAGLSLDDWAKMRGSVDADKNGSVKKAELTGYIEAHFPKERWRELFDAYKGGQNWKNPY